MTHRLALLLTCCLVAACSAPEPEDTIAPAPAAETAPVVADAAPVVRDAAPASDVDTPGVRSVEAHVHGDAELGIVLEGNRVTVELESPLYNVLGFESAPGTDEQREAVRVAEVRLRDPGSLFTFDARANCVPQIVDEDAARLFGEDDHDHEHHEGEHHDGDHHHDDDHEHDDEHHDGEHADHSGHSELLIQYTFLCERPEALTRVSTGLFDAFPRMEAVDGVFLGSTAQASFSVSPARPQAELRP